MTVKIKNGNIIRNSYGALVAPYDTDAPNGLDIGASVSMVYDATLHTQTCSVELTSIPEPSIADTIKVVIIGIIDGKKVQGIGQASIASGVMNVSVIFKPAIVTSDITTGTFNAWVMPRLTVDGPVGAPIETVAVSLSNLGSAETDPVINITDPEWITTTYVTGQEIQVQPSTFQGNGQIEHRFYIADDAVGTNETLTTFTQLGTTRFDVAGDTVGKYINYESVITGDGIVTAETRRAGYIEINAVIVVTPVYGVDYDIDTRWRGVNQRKFFTPIIVDRTGLIATADSVDWSGQTAPTALTTEVAAVYPLGEVNEFGHDNYAVVMSPGSLVYGSEWEFNADGYAAQVPSGAAVGLNAISDSDPHGGDWSRVDVDGSYATNSGLRFRLVIDGVAGGFTERVVFLAPTTDPVVTVDSWVPVNMVRSQIQFNNNIFGGHGMQFFRCFATSEDNPEVVIGSMDISILIMTKDFGLNWETPPCNGLDGSFNGNAVWMNPRDHKRVVVACSARNRALFGNMANMSGLYYSNDLATNFDLKRVLPLIEGTSYPQRWQHQLFSHKPGHTTADNVQLYFVYNDINGQNGELLKSSDGGVSWTKIRNLDPVKYGARFYQLAFSMDGKLWLGCSNGLFMTSNPDTTDFSAVSGVASDGCRAVCTNEHTNKVACIIESTHLYIKPSGSSTFTAATALRNYDANMTDILMLNVSPVNENRMTAMYKNVSGAHRLLVTSNNGASWSSTNNVQMDGQLDNFSHAVFSQQYTVWHLTTEMKALCQRYQHMGRSTDGMVTSYWASNFFSWLDANMIAWHPTNTEQMMFAHQDLGHSFTSNRCDVGQVDKMSDTLYNNIKARYPGKPFAAHVIVPHPTANGAAFATAGSQFDQSPLIYYKDGNTALSNCIDLYSTYGDCGGRGQARTHSSDPFTFYAGKWRGKFANYTGTTVTSVSQILTSLTALADGWEFFDMCEANGDIIYGGSQVEHQAAEERIFRSVNGGVSWTLFLTPSGSNWFRPDDGVARVFSDRFNTGRIYLCGRDGKLRRVSTGGVVEVILDIRNWHGPAKQPYAPSYASSRDSEYSVHTFAQSRFDANIGYASTNQFGEPTVLMTTNLQAATPTWIDITAPDNGVGGLPKMLMKVWTDQHTDDVWGTSLHGTWVYPRPASHDTNYPSKPASSYPKHKIQAGWSV